MKKRLFTNLSTAVLSAFLFISACGTSGYDAPEEKPPEEITATEPVAPDGILEAVTWNIERYGTNESFQQTKNAVRVLDSLNADLFALQEIYNQEVLDGLLKPLTGYKGFTASYTSKSQQMAFVYNTNTITVQDSGFISKDDVRDKYAKRWNYYWANGRMPFYISFSYDSGNGSAKDFYAVIVHGKANTGGSAREYEEAYTRRQMAAEGLYYYLMDHKTDANTIVLGDYNDDVDESIFYYDDPGDFAETPYDEFVDDTKNFEVITKILSAAGKSSYLGKEENTDLIDHITMSDELFRFYIDQSASIYYDPQTYIQNYESTTSDHLPVWVKFDVAK